MRIVDAQIRTDTRTSDDLKNLAYFGTEAVVTTAHALKSFRTAADLLDYLENLVSSEPERLNSCGLTGYVALGVLPDAQPRRSHYEVWRTLPTLLGHESVVAVGEVGAWSDDKTAWSLFERQLKLADEHKLPVVVTPPSDLPVNMTYKMMARIEKLGFPPGRVLLNYSDETTVEAVLSDGYVAGIVAGGGGTSARRAAALVIAAIERQGSSERILVNSSLQAGPADVLSVPKLIAELEESLDESTIESVVCHNACEFYGISLG